MTPPTLSFGWEVDQSANSQALTFGLNPASYVANPRLAAYSAVAPINLKQGTNTAASHPHMPEYPAASGLSLSTDTPNTPPTAGSNPYDTPYTPTAKNYLYYALKIAPYISTNIQIQTQLFISQLFSINLAFSVSSFKALLWADAAFWYQFDSTNP